MFLLSVKWVFGDIANYFKFIYYKKKLEDCNEYCGEAVYSLCTHEKCFNLPLWKYTTKFCNIDPPNIKAYFAYISNFARFITRKGPLKINSLTYTQQALFALPISVMTNLKILIQKGIFLYPTQLTLFPKIKIRRRERILTF